METEDIIEAPLAEGAVAFMLRCHAGNELWDVPEWAVVTLTPQRAQSLLRLCEAVRELSVYKSRRSGRRTHLYSPKRTLYLRNRSLDGTECFRSCRLEGELIRRRERRQLRT